MLRSGQPNWHVENKGADPISCVPTNTVVATDAVVLDTEPGGPNLGEYGAMIDYNVVTTIMIVGF